MRSLIACTLILAAGSLAACSSESDPMQTPDAAPSIDAPAAPVGCLIPGDYGALGAKTGAANTISPNSLTVVLDAGPPRDSLFVKLNANTGVFAGGLATGTFTITGAESSLATCGLCVSLSADIVSGVGPTKLYFAQSGSVTITSTDPVAGSAQNLTLAEINLSGMAVTNGCTSKITSVAFSSQ